jgi:hypothetical protein
MFLAGAGLCIMLTLLLRIVASAPETHSALNVADAANVPAADVPADTADQLAPAPIQEPVQRPRALGSKPNVPPERQNRFKLLPADELEALNAQPRATERGPAVALAEGAKERPRQDPILGGQNRNGVPGAQFALGAQNPLPAGQHQPGGERQDFAQDPVTGAWFSKSNIWEVRDKYWLPIEGNEINRARFGLWAIGVRPVIELQWWFPRAVEVPEKHFKGKIAKLRFLAVLAPAQIKQAEDHVRVVQTRGCTADGFALVEAEALFFSPSWNLVSTNVKEKQWFPDGEMSVKKAGTGQLPVKGRDIESVRKALHQEEAGARIREVKWWPPRVNRADHHRLSKLRYEVSRNGIVRIDEIVFDHNDSKASYSPFADSLFPEYDRRTSKLEPNQR